MIRLLGNKEHEQAYKEAEKQAAEAKVAEQERVTLEKAAQERIAAEREAKAIVDKIEQERIFAENKAKAASGGYPLNGMSVEEIVQSLTDGAFSNISTLPSLDTYRKALRILCTSESPVASAFLKERNLKYASFVKGDLIQKVETGSPRSGKDLGAKIITRSRWRHSLLTKVKKDSLEAQSTTPRINCGCWTMSPCRFTILETAVSQVVCPSKTEWIAEDLQMPNRTEETWSCTKSPVPCRLSTTVGRTKKVAPALRTFRH